MKVQFFDWKVLVKSWSVQIWALVPILATIDYSTTWVDAYIPDHYKPALYGVLATIGLVARSMKQPKLLG